MREQRDRSGVVIGPHVVYFACLEYDIMEQTGLLAKERISKFDVAGCSCLSALRCLLYYSMIGTHKVW